MLQVAAALVDAQHELQYESTAECDPRQRNFVHVMPMPSRSNTTCTRTHRSSSPSSRFPLTPLLAEL